MRLLVKELWILINYNREVLKSFKSKLENKEEALDVDNMKQMFQILLKNENDEIQNTIKEKRIDLWKALLIKDQNLAMDSVEDPVIEEAVSSKLLEEIMDSKLKFYFNFYF